MSTYRHDIAELLDRAENLPEGPGQIGLCEEAVRLADTHGDEEAGFHARKQLIHAATFGGRPDLSLVAFSWCLARADQDPDAFDETELLWQYKWVVQHVGQFPHITRAQIEGLLDDMTARFRRHGSTLHAVHMIRRDLAVEMYDAATAESAHKKFRSVDRDPLSDCPACVNDGTIEYQLFLGRDEDALATARPALEGRMVCGEVPHRTYAYVVLPLLRLGKLERAGRSFKQGYKLVRANPKFVRHKAQHLAFLALTGNLARAATLFERHFVESIRSPSTSWKFEFYAAARLFLDRLMHGKAIPLLRVPEELRVNDEPTRPASQVAAWLDGQLREIAAAFDRRNGNDGFTQKIAWFHDQARFATDFPLDDRDRS
jgi:hypothetical protein